MVRAGIEPGDHRDHEGHLPDGHAALDAHRQHDQDEQAGNGQADVDEHLENFINDAAVIGGDEAGGSPESHAHQAAEEAQPEGERRALDHDRVQVAALLVAAEGQLPRGRLQAADRKWPGLNQVDC